MHKILVEIITQIHVLLLTILLHLPLNLFQTTYIDSSYIVNCNLIVVWKLLTSSLSHPTDLSFNLVHHLVSTDGDDWAPPGRSLWGCKY